MIKKSTISRADILLLVEQHGEEFLHNAPKSFKYEYKKEIVEDEQPAHCLHNKQSKETGENRYVARPVVDLEPSKGVVKFCYVNERDNFNRDEKFCMEPDWLVKALPFADNEFTEKKEADLDSCIPPHIPLMPWSRLWPFIKYALGHRYESKRIDVEKTVSMISKGETLIKVPVEECLGWGTSAMLIIDLNKNLLQFRNDTLILKEKIKKMRGNSGLKIVMFEHGPEKQGREFNGDYPGRREVCRIPPAHDIIFIISDLGLVDKEPARKNEWIRFGKKLKKAGHRPVALAPFIPGLDYSELYSYFHIAYWDKGQRFSGCKRVCSSPYVLSHGSDSANNRVVEDLLTLLSAAIFVEPELLRALRMMLPGSIANTGTEALVWNHDDVNASNIAICLKEKVLDRYRERFKKRFSKEDQEKAISLIGLYHSLHFQGLRNEEEMIGYTLLGKSDYGYLERVVRTIHKGDYQYLNYLKQYATRLFSRTHLEMRKSDVVQALWALNNLEAFKKGLIETPDGVDLDQIFWVFSQKAKPVNLLIWQKGKYLLVNRGNDYLPTENGFKKGSPIVVLKSSRTLIKIVKEKSGIKIGYIFNSEKCEDICLPLTTFDTIEHGTDSEQIKIKTMPRPPWALQTGRDEFGLFADLDVKGVCQRFRWINPGRFLMGSPQNEAERFDSEKQHEVILNTKLF